MTTNVPGIEFTLTGLQLPQESAILAGVQTDFNDAFGGDLSPALETPQGQLSTSLTAVIADKNALMAEFVNQVNPDTADGFMQDAIARIYFIDRSPGAPTVVQCACVGANGTVIPVNAQAQDTSGNRYVCQTAGIISGGSVTLPFANVRNGPVPCPADSLNQIFQAITGWESINNPADGIIGADVESQQQFAFRRQQSVALNAIGSLPSIYAAVFDVDGVIDVYVTENTTGGTVPTGATDYPLIEHSLYVAAIGGTDANIAQAIWRKKDTGCDYNGNTEVIVTDPSGYSAPLPTYTVKFQRPAPLPILFSVDIQDDPNNPADIVVLTKNAVANAFNGITPGSTRVRIGSLLLASRFYQFVQAIGSEISVISILLGDVAPDATNLLIGIDQAPTIDVNDIDVNLV